MIEVKGLRKRFGDVQAVDGATFSCAPGEVFGLLGPNGAGKTTTIAMVCGLLQPDEGSVTLGEAGSPSEPAARALLGVAPQSLAIYPELTARENLAFFGRMYGMGGPALKERVQALLEFVGLADRARSRAGTFSGGMQRRLNLAAAMLHDPPVLLLDEPTAGVDPQSRMSLLETVERLREQGRTIVYTTHYMEEAQRVCDRVAVMDRGKVLALGTVDELIGEHGGPRMVAVERANGVERFESADPVADLTRVLSEERPLEVRVERPTLETVFLNLTGRELRD